MSKKAILAILDGWGIGSNDAVSALAQAKTPFMDEALKKYPNAKLQASGLAVGLPEGQMGNSEVGHMNLGAGRVVYQNLVMINNAVKDKTLGKMPEVVAAYEYAKKNGKPVHFIGLVSDGGVHSHINHLKGLIEAADDFGLKDVFVHAFTDGRDCDPHSGKGFISEIMNYMKEKTGKLAGIIGRYYAMDRDKRWEREKLAYDMMVNGIGFHTEDPIGAIENSYREEITDEFIKPIVVTENGKPVATIQDGDVVFCFNFRTDRGRQISTVLTQKDFPEFGMHKLPLYYVTMTQFDDSYQNVKVVYEESVIQKTLGEIIEKEGLSQIRIAETEKYPHVTFFFSGGREEEFKNERRILCPSPKDVPTYDYKPEMSANDITKAIVPELENETADFICLNFANTDMVGHTGVFEAAVKAAETVDHCIQQVATTAYEHGYSVFILADHGNSDIMKNPDGSPNTQHTTNLVPFIVMDKARKWNVKDGKLGDVAPTILTAMGVEIPKEMTGNILIS